MPPASSIVRSLIVWLTAALAVCLYAPPPAAAQSQDYQERWVLDKYSLGFSGRFNSLDTKLRVDSELLGVGTEVDAEDFLGLDTDDNNYDITAELRFARKHRLAGSYSNFNRDQSREIDREIQVGETVFPVDALVRTELDIQTISFSYRYYPWLEENWALGFGLGFRWYDFALEAGVNDLDLLESADISAPMPFVGADFRYAVTSRVRASAAVGYFDVELGDLAGSQILAEGSAEYLILPYLTAGAGVDLGQLDVDFDGDNWDGAADSDIIGLRLFVKLRS